MSVLRLADVCREALNDEVYGGAAPTSSNALSEVWPTETGAEFLINTDEGDVTVTFVLRKGEPEDALPVR